MKISAEHHDWDITLSSSRSLFSLAQKLETNSKDQFACYTGSMILSVAALESFMNSMGFGEDLVISWDSYQRLPIIDKLSLIGSLLDIDVQRGSEPYQTISRSIRWRNEVMHSKPIRVLNQEINNAKAASSHPIQQFKKKYEFHVNKENAEVFYKTICKVIDEFRSAGKEKL